MWFAQFLVLFDFFFYYFGFLLFVGNCKMFTGPFEFESTRKFNCKVLKFRTRVYFIDILHSSPCLFPLYIRLVRRQRLKSTNEITTYIPSGELLLARHIVAKNCQKNLTAKLPILTRGYFICEL